MAVVANSVLERECASAARSKSCGLLEKGFCLEKASCFEFLLKRGCADLCMQTRCANRPCPKNVGFVFAAKKGVTTM